MTVATKMAAKKTMKASDYLKMPYGRVVVPEVDGTFRAEIPEFPGCITTGETASEALASLERVAESWLEATLARRQAIPEPAGQIEYSGRLVLRLPKSAHRLAARYASHDAISLNQFIVNSVCEKIGSLGAGGGKSTVTAAVTNIVIVATHQQLPQQPISLPPSTGHLTFTIPNPIQSTPVRISHARG